jgi:HlyD family type I secretion membrane fusion protein
MNISQNTADTWQSRVKQETMEFTLFGGLCLAGFVLVLTLWSVFFPIASAVISIGTVIPDGQSKVVQHPTGGVVAAIHARDGENIRLGDLIMTLDPLEDKAEMERLDGEYIRLQAIEARLNAQIAGDEEILFPEEFYTDNRQAYRTALHRQVAIDQLREFRALRQQNRQQISGLQQQTSALQEQARGLRARQASVISQEESLRRQLERVRPLVTTGDYSRNRAEELERQLLQLQGERQSNAGEIASLDFRIAESRDRIAELRSTRRAEVSNELSTVKGEMLTISKQIDVASSNLTRRDVRSPADGVITNSSLFTIGAVVRAGETLAEIVPGQRYMVEARVAPQDIDHVSIGSSARVIITAFNRRLYDPVEAEVIYVAADATMDEQTGLTFYTARLALAPSLLPQEKQQALRAGMQAEVYINTGKRSFLSYLVQPLTDGYRRAFREQ